MIKKFLACNTVRERIDLLSNTVMDSWTDQDLNIILSAFNMNPENYGAKEDKIAAIEKHLADYKHEVENEATMDCSRIDSMPAKEEVPTLYEEKGLSAVVNHIFIG